MFSPIVAIAEAIASPIVLLPAWAALIASTSAPVRSAACAINFTRPWKWSLRATKSVSELTSTRMPRPSASATATRPPAARRPAFFADSVSILGAELRDLPEMENAELVESLLDRGGNRRKFLEVVGNPARTGQRLKRGAGGLHGRLLDDGLLGGAEVDAHLALR